MKITFLGGAEEVTGSRYLVEDEGTKILVDCGMFQGSEELKELNWARFPVDPSSIEAVVLTHAHIDHTGYIPALVKKGFKGKIYCSKATYMLCSILLLDSGFIQEENAKRANEDDASASAVHLYTKADAKHSLHSFKIVDYSTVLSIGISLTVTLISSSHILGSSFVVVSNGKRTLTFSGDLGRPNQLIMKAPTHLKHTDYLVIESTYGDKLHAKGDPIKALGEIVNKTVEKGGTLIIPSFAVGRAQTILYGLYELQQKKLIPDIPIFLDSPMAIRVTDLLCKFQDELKLSPSVCKKMSEVAIYTPTVKESKRIDNLNSSSIIIAGSGMITGGRVIYHLKHFISDSRNTIFFVGFQAEGTRGRELVDGAKKITIHGQSYEVRAEIKKIDTLSAHADYNEIFEWLGYFENTPKKVFVTHGEIEAAKSLQQKIEQKLGWSVVVPKYLESFDLD
jgi:metallo-beta-lactamase family protein